MPPDWHMFANTPSTSSEPWPPVMNYAKILTTYLGTLGLSPTHAITNDSGISVDTVTSTPERSLCAGDLPPMSPTRSFAQLNLSQDTIIYTPPPFA